MGEADNAPYHVVFAVMQYQQTERILGEPAQINSSLVVLVGNNPAAGEMERAIQTRTQMPKTVLFGFQGTGGRREVWKGRLRGTPCAQPCRTGKRCGCTAERRACEQYSPII